MRKLDSRETDLPKIIEKKKPGENPDLVPKDQSAFYSTKNIHFRVPDATAEPRKHFL